MSEKNKTLSSLSKTSNIISSNSAALCEYHKENWHESMDFKLYATLPCSLGNNSSICCSLYEEICSDSAEVKALQTIRYRSCLFGGHLSFFIMHDPVRMCNVIVQREKVLGCQAELLLAAAQIWHKVMAILCKDWWEGRVLFLSACN